MRLIALDTETTGLHSKNGDRVIELAMVEITRSASPREYHSWFNPQGREISPDAFAVHGISADFLEDKPLFHEKFDEIRDFIGDATLVIHNAPFDLEFLRDESLEANLIWPEAPVIDTLKIASHERPGKHNSLDALCNWLGIDTTVRTKHSALVDTRLLAEVYLRWKGQSSLDLDAIQGTSAPLNQLSGPVAALNPLLLPDAPSIALPSPSWAQFLSGHKI